MNKKITIRLGYACICTSLDGITSSKTYQYSKFSVEKDYQKLEEIIRENLINLSLILKFNQKNNIHFYRITSNLIPLATHPNVNFDYTKKYTKEYTIISNIIKESKMRLDFHPSTYCILNSARSEVVESTIKILEYHYRLLENLKIEDITKQYLDYTKHMKELNLEIASEYLVMASELIEMKSKMLLPKKREKEEDDYEEDPRELLIERLLAYKRYKEVTSEFKDLELTRKMIFTREPDNLNRYAKEEESIEELGVADLIDAFNNLLKRKELDRPIATKITKKELSVADKVNKIKNILRNKKRINFEEIFEVSTKEEVIISFLSVLEMVKKDEILLTQDGNFKNIVISLKEGE